MNMLDTTRDEIQLTSAIVDTFAGRFVFTSSSDSAAQQPQPVDPKATNAQVALRGQPLEDFMAVPPGDPRVVLLDEVVGSTQPLAPQKMAMVLLCGGLSFRSQHKVHPLRRVTDPQTGETRTLLDRQLDRLDASPLKEAARLIAGTPLNEAAFRTHLLTYPPEKRPRLYIGGLAPRLLPVQNASGPSLVLREPSGTISYNPAGHLDALRWLVVSGVLRDLLEAEVILMMSYSNWGRIFTEETLRLANFVVTTTQAHPETLMFVEVPPRPSEKETCSLLVANSINDQNLRLVKYNYGQGRPRISPGTSVLMSTNTLYFSVPNLLRRLHHAAPTMGLPGDRAHLVQLLHDAAEGHRRSQLATLFDTALPVEPHLIPTSQDGAVSFLRAERDLDQLTLIPGPSPAKAVQVPADREVSLKRISDFEAPDKQRFLFGT